MKNSVRVNQTQIELTQGDITRETTEAIVNAANSSLMGGGGVDGAIHRAAGPQLLVETLSLGGCPTGDAKITRGYNLNARYVIHAVGPIYRRDDPQAPALLRSAHWRSLEIATTQGIGSIAFPAISTGAYGYPVDQAAPVALQAVMDYARQDNIPIRLVRFVLFDGETLAQYATALARLADKRSSSP